MATIRQRAYANVTREPPKEIQLWNRGSNPTDYGVHVWNQRSILEVMTRYGKRGNPIVLDVEHNGAQLANGEPAITAGYARLEVRAGAPWLVFEWSDYGRQQIASGARRFLSPEYDVDSKTGEIVTLYRVSLVADPGTHRARMLAASRNGGNSMNTNRIYAELSPDTQNTPSGPMKPATLEDVKAAAKELLSNCEDAPPEVLRAVVAGLKKIASTAFESGDEGGTVTTTARALGLSTREVQKCMAQGIDPKRYAKIKSGSTHIGGQ